MAGLLWACSPQPSAPTSVLLVTIDTLRADHVSGYGYAAPTSPHLDAFMARGGRFLWAFSSSSYTGPSHSSLLTGLYPSFHHGLGNYGSKSPPPVRTLAEVCAAAGMRTAAIVSNPILGSRYGSLAEGFESYDDALPDREAQRNMAERRADDAVDRAIEKLGTLAGDRFFFWLHVQDPHGPYTPPAEFAERHLGPDGPGDPATLPVGGDHSGHRAIPRYQAVDPERRVSHYVARYDGETSFVDTQLGRLFDAIGELGLRDDLLVVVTADHGEAMGEDDFYFGHGHAVTPGLTRVPLAFVGPGVQAGSVFSQPVSAVDVHATVVDLLGLSRGGSDQGQSLREALATGGEPAPHAVFVESHGHRAVAFDGFMLHRDRRPAGDRDFWHRPSPVTLGFHKPLGERWYRLDPEGSTHVGPQPAGPLPALLEGFEERAERALAATSSEAEPDPEDLEALRALGYVR